MTFAPETASRPLEIESVHPLPRDEIRAVLGKLPAASIAVIGDFCLDAYWMIDSAAAEISVETGLPTRPVRQQRYAPGGAGNVVTNLIALGVGSIIPVGVVGDDPFGRELLRLLGHRAVARDHLLVKPTNWQTQTYVKPHLDGTEAERIDFGNFNAIDDAMADRLLERIDEILKGVSVAIINHQVAGSLHNSQAFRRGLARLMEEHSAVRFIVDSRGYHEAYPRAFHKLNEAEVIKASGDYVAVGAIGSLEDLLPRARLLSQRWRSPLVMTRGAKGCLVVDGEHCRQVFGVQLLGSVDPVGAGDAFVAALAGTIAAGANPVSSAYIANLAASVTAQKLFQTGTPSPCEILEAGSRADFVYRPDLAYCAKKARYLAQTEIELIQELPAKASIRHVIFDHDGTISTLREGWEQIMEPLMVRAILGARSMEDEALIARARR